MSCVVRVEKEIMCECKKKIENRIEYKKGVVKWGSV
jgi:hypothetical protein